MRRLTFYVTAVCMLISAATTQGFICTIVNGSFEDDGPIPDITIYEPNGWDVNMPGSKFSGWVGNDWVTDGNLNLTISSNWLTAFQAGDIALVLQEVDLRDANLLTFDLNLDTSGGAWNPAKRTFVVMIDETIVWESGSTGSDVRGEYFDCVVDVSAYNQGPYLLSFGLRVNQNEGKFDSLLYYYADIDYVGLDCDCRGYGIVPGDFNIDCVVDINDLKLLSKVWLEELPVTDKFNLYDVNDAPPYGIINFRDYAVLADIRDSNDLSDIEFFTSIWLDEVETGDEWNLYGGDDIQPLDWINFLDYAVFAENWLKSSYD